MQIIFIPKNQADALMNVGLDEIDSKEFESIKKELNRIDFEVEIKDVNLGIGADWIAILAIINSVVNVLMIGDKLIKGIDGWVEVGKRLKKIFKKADRVYLDNDAATILAIEYISKSVKIQSLEKISEEIIYLKDLSKMLLDRKSDDFISRPYNIYIHTYKINNELVKILAIRSDGEIKEIYSFDDMILPDIPF